MATRVHNFVGANPNPGASFVEGAPSGSDDDGAPPPMPANGRVTTVGNDGAILAESSSPQSDLELAAKREAAAAKLAAVKPTKLNVYEGPGIDLRSLRARCLEIAARGDVSTPAQVIADARALLAFVENG